MPVVDIDCDQQTVFEDKDVLQQLHPKLRRLLQPELSTKDRVQHARVRAAQKAVEKHRVTQACNSMQRELKDWLAQALVKHSRLELTRLLQPGVSRKVRKGVQKTPEKKVIRN